MLHVVPRFRYFRECQRGRSRARICPPRRATTFLPLFKNPLRRSVLFAVSLCSAGAAVRLPRAITRVERPTPTAAPAVPGAKKDGNLGEGGNVFAMGQKR